MLHPHPMTTTAPTLEQLTHAVKIAEQIAALEAELAAIFGNSPVVKVSAAAPVKKKGGMSAAGKARIAEAQKARAKATVEAPVKKKRKLSPEARAKMAAAAKARWAALKKK